MVFLQRLSSNIAQSSTEVMAVWLCGGVLVVFLWWCFCVGCVVVFFVMVFFVMVFLWWCFCGGVLVVVFVWWCFGVLVVFLWWCFCKDCHQTSPKVLPKWWLSHQTSPKVLLKWWLSAKIVIKHRPKFYWSDGCLQRLSSNIAQSSTEVMAVSSNIAQSSTEVMAVFKDCHQTSPKVLLKWWLSLKIVIKGCPKFYWRDACLKRLSSNIAQRSAEVMAVFKDVINHRLKFYWSDACLKKIVIKDCRVWLCVCVCLCVCACVYLSVCSCVCVCVCHHKSLINGLVENAWILVCFAVWKFLWIPPCCFWYSLASTVLGTFAGFHYVVFYSRWIQLPVCLLVENAWILDCCFLLFLIFAGFNCVWNFSPDSTLLFFIFAGFNCLCVFLHVRCWSMTFFALCSSRFECWMWQSCCMRVTLAVQGRKKRRCVISRIACQKVKLSVTWSFLVMAKQCIAVNMRDVKVCVLNQTSNCWSWRHWWYSSFFFWGGVRGWVRLHTWNH